MIKSRLSFETLRPYYDEELNDAFGSLTAPSHFAAIAGYIFFERSMEEINHQLYKNYKLWEPNYMAWDLREGENTFTGNYSQEERKQFTSYMAEGLSSIEGKKEEPEEIFLSIYSNPVRNLKSIES